MTKRERAQVVEVLRCAADLCVTSPEYSDRDAAEPAIWWAAVYYAAPSATLKSAALNAEHAVNPHAPHRHDRIVRLLEAAARCEEGSWP